MQAVNTIIVLLFTGLVVAGGLRTAARYVEYRRINRPIPALLIRDLLSRNGLALSFFFILLARAAELGPLVRDQLWWTVLTAAPAIFGAAVYAYFEFFIIDRVDPDSYGRRQRKD